MFKKYKNQIILSSAVILLPMLYGLIMWNLLPDTMATHWNAASEPDGWSSKAFAVFAVPLILLPIHLLCIWITDLTNKGNEQNPKVLKLIFWIMPVLSLAVNGTIYAVALDKGLEIVALLPILLGLLFIVIGNLLPKCTRNATIGIKVIWALTNDENWHATHRFAGKVWVAGGVLTLFSALLPASTGYPIMFISLIGAGLSSTLYSYLYYRKQLKAGTVVSIKDIPTDDPFKKTRRITWPIGIAILVFCAVFLFTGSIEFDFREDALVIDATFYSPITLEYDSIDTIEYREGNVDGARVAGFGSARLLLGGFQNDEFGMYTRYTYCNPKGCIVITSGDNTLVFSGKDSSETQELYRELLDRIG